MNEFQTSLLMETFFPVMINVILTVSLIFVQNLPYCKMLMLAAQGAISLSVAMCHKRLKCIYILTCDALQFHDNGLKCIKTSNDPLGRLNLRRSSLKMA